MFWGDSNYPSSPNIEALLGKPDVKLNELLDDEDILQECKTQNKKLLQFLGQPNIIDELVSHITTEPPSDLPETSRYKYANISCELLTSDDTLYYSLASNENTLLKLYKFLQQEPPLNPLLCSFCCKTFSNLIPRKSEQDWFSYQSVCLQVLEFIKLQDDFFDSLLKHIDMPVVMDLLFHILTQTEESDMKKDLLDYVNEKKLLENLIKILGVKDDEDKHQNIAQFISEIIQTGRTVRQDERQNKATEVSDPLLELLENKNTTKLLLDTILNENTCESGVVAGIKIILTLFQHSIVNQPASDAALQFLIDSEKTHHQKVVLGLIDTIIPTMKQFHEILLNPPEKFNNTNPSSVNPSFGYTRLQICCLFTVLIETENIDVFNAICEINYFNTLLKLFKEYCWNNFLHNEVNKCIVYSLKTFDKSSSETVSISALQKNVITDCKIVSKLLDCWSHNETMQTQENGRRLGYMGHLIKMFEQLVTSVKLSNELCALVELSLTEDELDMWKKLTDPVDGGLSKVFELQKRNLANYAFNEETLDSRFDSSPAFYPHLYNEDFNNTPEFDAVVSALEMNDFDFQMNDSDLFDATIEEMLASNRNDTDDIWDSDMDTTELGAISSKTIKKCSNDDEQLDEINGDDGNIEFGTIIGGPWKSSDNGPLSLNFSSPWGTDLSSESNNDSKTSKSNDNWANFEPNNFADFDSHFDDFQSSAIPISLPNSYKDLNRDNNQTESIANCDNNPIIHEDDRLSKLNRLYKGRNLIPGADGRLVLQTTNIPFDNKSDNNANIRTTKSFSETDLDNHSELINNTVPLNEDENSLNKLTLENCDPNPNVENTLANGPKNSYNESEKIDVISSEDTSSVLEDKIDQLSTNISAIQITTSEQNCE